MSIVSLTNYPFYHISSSTLLQHFLSTFCFIFVDFYFSYLFFSCFAVVVVSYLVCYFGSGEGPFTRTQ